MGRLEGGFAGWAWLSTRPEQNEPCDRVWRRWYPWVGTGGAMVAMDALENDS